MTVERSQPSIGGIPTSTSAERELDYVRQLARAAARAAASKGGEDTLVLEVSAISSICDAFVLTSGRNPRQVRTMAEEVEAQLKALDAGVPLRIEGADTAEWIVLDYGDFVVHLFLDDLRRYYELERLWSDAPRLEWEQAGVK